jgi:hypothetical protein
VTKKNEKEIDKDIMHPHETKQHLEKCLVINSNSVMEKREEVRDLPSMNVRQVMFERRLKPK